MAARAPSEAKPAGQLQGGKAAVAEAQAESARRTAKARVDKEQAEQAKAAMAAAAAMAKQAKMLCQAKHATPSRHDGLVPLLIQRCAGPGTYVYKARAPYGV